MRYGSFTLDLEPFGIDASVRLEGSLVEQHLIDGAALVFIFDENHSYLAGIRQSIGNALKLIDAGIVDLVGVEGISGSVRTAMERVFERLNRRCATDIRRRLRNINVPEQRLIEMGVSFAQMLALLAPQVPVYGVEDPEAYERAGQEIDQWRMNTMLRRLTMLFETIEGEASTAAEGGEEGEFVAQGSASLELDREVLRRLRAEADEFINRRLLSERPHHFITNLLELRRRLASKGAAILNAGRKDQDAVCRIVRIGNLCSIIRIRPAGFPEPLSR